MAWERPKTGAGWLIPLYLGLLGGLLFPSNLWGQGSSGDSLARQEEAAIRAAVAHVADSVVQIRTIGGMTEVDHTLLADGPTTGVIISADGWIVSSSFNFIQQPTSILVTMPSGEQLPAELVAKDHSRLLAMLKVEGASDLPVPEFVPPEEGRVGQWAIAVGRTFRVERPNISVGIVSAVDRMFGKVLQTDADVSVANYGGPLIDIRGRVLGIIVPMAPQTTSEVAGAEWYDSGIGFAAPLAGFEAPLERMKRGDDLYAGKLGIGLEGNRPHEMPAELAVAMPNSPAGRVGLKKGDRIVAIDGEPIHTQTDLRFALGPRYGGEEVRVTVQRDDEQLERDILLTGELEPFRHAFLGIVPQRGGKTVDSQSEVEDVESDDAETENRESDSSEKGVAVRMVFDGSPAADAGIQVGDIITKIDQTRIHETGDAIMAMNAVWPGAEVVVAIERDGERFEQSIRAAQMPTTIPSELAADDEPVENHAANDDNEQAGEIRDLKLAEFPQGCRVYVPASTIASRPLSVLLWIHAPGEPPDDDLFERWQAICDRDNLLLVAPTSSDPSRWERTELEYLRRLTERVTQQFRIDPNRVVVAGRGGGGTMAWYLGLAGRDLFTGVATWSSSLPRTIRVPDNAPSQRLAILAGLPADSRRLAQMRIGLQKLADAGYSVAKLSQSDTDGALSDDEREELARWIDSLDRF